MLLKELPEPSSLSARTMADTKSGSPGKPHTRRPHGTDGRPVEAFDIWLQRGLHQLYDSVAKEPIPNELLRLIEEDRADRDK